MTMEQVRWGRLGARVQFLLLLLPLFHYLHLLLFPYPPLFLAAITLPLSVQRASPHHPSTRAFARGIAHVRARAFAELLVQAGLTQALA